MSTFQVPQFIEQKAKIIGPLTLKQFGFLGIAGFISVICFYTFSFSLWLVITIIIGIFALGFAFIKINGQDMLKIVLLAFRYLWNPHTYTWQRAIQEQIVDTANMERLEAVRQTMGLQEKIKSFALSIMTGKPKLANQLNNKTEETRYTIIRHLTGEREKARKVDYKA